MEQIHYTISEAAKKLQVEPHVLRYWEDELHLSIPRSKKGHRTYSDKEMAQLDQVIQMKKNGYSLKEINTKISRPSGGQIIPYPVDNTTVEAPDDQSEKMEQFKKILGRIVSEAIHDNSNLLTSDISATVSEQINKELNFLFREKEESDEKRFRELDETIRSYQKARQETASAKMSEKKAKNRHVFGKK